MAQKSILEGNNGKYVWGGGVGAHQLIKTQREERKVRGERKGVSRLINKLVREAEKLPGDEDWRKDTSAP